MQTNDHHWLGARGNGNHQVWLNGEIVTTDEPWYNNAYNNAATNDCVFLLTDHKAYRKGTVLSAYRCHLPPSGYGVLCG